MADEAGKKTILIADDDRDMVYALSSFLDSAGYRIRCAADGDECVSMAVEEPPDLILLDFIMPGKNGFDACRELRQVPALRDVPIIVLTAFGQGLSDFYDTDEAEMATGVQGFLEKPVEPNVLLERLASAPAGEEGPGGTGA